MQCLVNRSPGSIGNPQDEAKMGTPTMAAQPVVTVANAGMDLLEQDAMLLQSMPLRARRVIVRLKSAKIVYHSTNLRVRTRT